MHRRPKRLEVVLILWGANGDEAAATVFACELRTAGYAVKLVGLSASKIKGRCGVVLVPDMTLGDAFSLAGLVTYVVLPFDGDGLRRFISDPRLQKFIDEAHAHGALFIQSDHVAKDAELPILFGLNRPYEVRFYPKGEALYHFARQLYEPRGVVSGDERDAYDFLSDDE